MKLMTLSIALIGIMSFSSCDTRTTLERRIDKCFSVELSYEIDTPNAPGYAVLIMQNDEPLLSKGYGYANVHLLEKLSPEQSFYAPGFDGFLIKVITLLILDEYDIPLNSKISELSFPASIDYLSNIDPQVTMGHIISGTSGISAGFPPGDMYEWCTEEYDLMEAFIEEHTKMEFHQLAEKYILDTLNLKSTFFITDANAKNLIKHHMRSAGKYNFIEDDIRQGFIATSLSDIRTILRYIFSLEVIQVASNTPVILNNDNRTLLSDDYTLSLAGWMWNTGIRNHYFILDDTMPCFSYTFCYNYENNQFTGIAGNFNGVETFTQFQKIQAIGNDYF